MITVELTEKEIYYLNKRNIFTRDREIGDWSGEDVTILDKLTFNDQLPNIHVHLFDKKKERNMFDKNGFTSEYKIRYKMSIDLDADEIDYLKNPNAEDFSWRASHLETLLPKLRNLCLYH